MPVGRSSALSSWVLLIAKAIDSYGYDSRTLFAQAGLDHARLRDPVARFSATAVLRLWKLAAERTDDPCFGLTAARFWHPTTLHALGYAWLASSTLEKALDRAVRYSRIVNTAANGLLRLEPAGESVRVVIDVSELPPPASAGPVDAGLAMLVIMCRASCGDDFDPVRVTVQHESAPCAERFTEFFRAPIDYAQPENALYLDRHVVTMPLATANIELVRVNDQIVTEYLAKFDRHDVTMRVRAALIEFLPSGHVAEESIARTINLSARSLQRRLREQGTTYKQLLDDTRRELAGQYAKDPRRSFNEITFLLGFSEQSNFTRAFKRWYGVPPSVYRAGGLAEPG